ncbi:uncharacterized protein LOC131655124 [Vicia villosa]|uniref:uncharacterized protein LOC131655124 n=1 Tax=Vicia villosa TaxID=3911 RepID=UPI00273A7E95|nr:uncharacterized protein LOC131655124 [Vicia villosa]
MNIDNFPQRWLARFDLKIFAVNNRGDLLPNLWCICKSSLNPVILLCDDQHFDFTISLNDTIFGFSVVYASTNYIHRRHLWNSLNNIPDNIPWTFLGDFNAIASPSEYRGSHTPAKIPMQDFLNWSDRKQLLFLPTLGNAFTWCNGRRGRNRTEKMLDRVLCNLNILDSCNSIVCNTLTKSKSDHYPILATIKLDNATFRSQFKFHKMWTLDQDCSKLVKDTWNVKIYGCPMYVLDQKLKILKKKLRTWNKTTFGNIHDKSKLAAEHLKDIQKTIEDYGYTDTLHDKEIKAQHDLDLALNMEEELWKEKSRINWHIHGDRNTRYFHTYAKIKRKTKLISSLLVDGNIETDPYRLENHIDNHFNNIFNSGFVRQDTGLVQRVIPRLVNETTNELLTRIPNDSEIYNAITSLNIDSAPGPDGYGAFFYVHYWDIVKTDVLNATKQFFLHNWILPNYNANNVVLIPKTNDANCIEQFRPIAMANFKFKIISKILADRLGSILPNIISNEQKGFIAGRNIKDGICLTSEAINILGNKSFSGNVALKIDIAKAFDTLNWDFILSTMHCFGFNSKFCGWIHTILKSAALSICVNGKMAGFFNCSNGVRQGDPLSPLLFCIAEDVLSRGIQHSIDNNMINLTRANRFCTVPSHTFFADDLMIFCRGDIKSMNAISALLEEYALNSGQICNGSKSIMYAGGLSNERHCTLANILGFSIASPPFIHLGVPIFIGKPKAIHFQALAGKIKLKLASWKANLLSMAGRVILVKSVIQSMMVHTITIYDWPASIIKSIDTWTKNFIWSGNIEKRKLITVAWSKCCSKAEEGGLGIISLKHYNKATNLFLCWQLLSRRQPWASLLYARVFRNRKALSYNIQSSLWKGLKEWYTTVLEHNTWVIGNGKMINFWLDNWSGEVLASKFKVPDCFHPNLKVTVADCWNNGWAIHTNILTALPNLLNSIRPFFVSGLDFPDTLAWNANENGILTIKDAYKMLKKPSVSSNWSLLPWDYDSAPSQSMLVWKIMHRKVSTDENLNLRGFLFPSMCSLCLCHEENTNHLFFNCSFAVNIWRWFSSQTQSHLVINSLDDCLQVLRRSWNPQSLAVIKASMVCTFSQIWHARNLARFEGKHLHWKNCITMIMARAKLVGSTTTRKSDNSIHNFFVLKNFEVTIQPRVPKRCIDSLWFPPDVSWIKCNIDGAAAGSPFLAASGGLFRDNQANHIISFCTFLGTGSPLFAEFMAAIIAIEKAKEMLWSKLWIETDSLIVVNAFSNPSLVPWTIKTRWLNCWKHTLEIDFRISHIFREANFCADILASIGLKSKSSSWFNYVHKDIFKDYLLDKAGTPRPRLCS